MKKQTNTQLYGDVIDLLGLAHSDALKAKLFSRSGEAVSEQCRIFSVIGALERVRIRMDTLLAMNKAKKKR